MTLIRRASVDQHRWLTDEEFNRDWALCQMTPGINLIALSILIGRRIAGWRGVAICLLGLVFPSALLTILLTAAYVSIRGLPAIQATLKGLLPASVGLGLVTAVQMGRKPAGDAWQLGIWTTVFVVFLTVGSGALLASGKLSVTLVLLCAGIIGAVENSIRYRLSGSKDEQ